MRFSKPTAPGALAGDSLASPLGPHITGSAHGCWPRRRVMPDAEVLHLQHALSQSGSLRFEEPARGSVRKAQLTRLRGGVERMEDLRIRPDVPPVTNQGRALVSDATESTRHGVQRGGFQPQI